MKNNNFPYKNSKDYQRKLLNVAYSAIGFPMIFFLWLLLKMTADDLYPMVSGPMEYVVIFISILLVGGLIWMALVTFKSGITLSSEEKLLKEKLIIYEKVSERKFLFLFIASAITTLGLYLCANQLFTAIYALLIVFFSIGNPTRDRIAADLKLTKEDKRKVITGEDFNFDY